MLLSFEVLMRELREVQEALKSLHEDADELVKQTGRFVGEVEGDVECGAELVGSRLLRRLDILAGAASDLKGQVEELRPALASVYEHFDAARDDDRVLQFVSKHNQTLSS